jgi:hypothetical protein
MFLSHQGLLLDRMGCVSACFSFMRIRLKILFPLALWTASVGAVLMLALYLLLPIQFIRGAGPALICGALLLIFLGAAVTLELALRRGIVAGAGDAIVYKR